MLTLIGLFSRAKRYVAHSQFWQQKCGCLWVSQLAFSESKINFDLEQCSHMISYSSAVPSWESFFIVTFLKPLWQVIHGNYSRFRSCLYPGLRYDHGNNSGLRSSFCSKVTWLLSLWQSRCQRGLSAGLCTTFIIGARLPSVSPLLPSRTRPSWFCCAGRPDDCTSYPWL